VTQIRRREINRSQVSLTTVFTVCAGVLLVLAVVMFVVHSLLALTLTISAIMIAVALHHGVAFLERRLRMPRPAAVAVMALGTLAVGVGLAFIVIPPAASQGKELVTHAQEIIGKARQTRLFARIDQEYQIADHIEDLRKRLPQIVSGAAGQVLTIVGSVFNGLAAAVSIFFLAIFMVIFGGDLVNAILGETLPERRQRYEKLVEKIYDLIGGYLGGLFLICSINAICTTTFLAILGMRFFLPLGLASGFSSLVPYAGPFVAGTTISLLALVTGGLWKGIACGIYFVVYGQMEGNVLSPLVFRRTVHVNPLVVTLSILFFGEIGGLVGAILAVPITAALQIVAREILRARRERLNLPKTEMNTPTETT
jgi:predicted PurR-regulated permease PerM